MVVKHQTFRPRFLPREHWCIMGTMFRQFIKWTPKRLLPKSLKERLLRKD